MNDEPRGDHGCIHGEGYGVGQRAADVLPQAVQLAGTEKAYEHSESPREGD